MTQEDELQQYRDKINAHRADRRVNGPRSESNGRRFYDIKEQPRFWDVGLIINLVILLGFCALFYFA